MNVVITGASSGIGRALVIKFIQQGHSVLAVARRQARLQELTEELVKNSSAALYILDLDITSHGATQILYEEAARLFGNVHILINNAAMSPYQEFRELHHVHLHQIISLNIQSLSELCYLFIHHMVSHGEPSHIVNVGSVGGYTPLPRFSVYSGSKHYVRIFTNLLHHEYRGSNVKVTALHPGGTLTEFPELAGQEIKESARNTMLTPEQVAEIAYPGIMKGKRLIVTGGINKLAVLIGKLLPFPWAIRVMELVYDNSMDQVEPTYPI